MNSKEHTCCFLGHRKIEVADELVKRLEKTIEELITDKNVDTFLFGSKSQFNKLCLTVVTKLKEKHPHIRRIYVRAEFPCISEDYREYLLENYEDTYYPERIINAGRAVYVERNYEMIEKSEYCVVYFDEGYIPSPSSNSPACSKRKSGTKLAYEYAIKKHLYITNVKN